METYRHSPVSETNISQKLSIFNQAREYAKLASDPVKKTAQAALLLTSVTIYAACGSGSEKTSEHPVIKSETPPISVTMQANFAKPDLAPTITMPETAVVSGKQLMIDYANKRLSPNFQINGIDGLQKRVDQNALTFYKAQQKIGDVQSTLTLTGNGMDGSLVEAEVELEGITVPFTGVNISKSDIAGAMSNYFNTSGMDLNKLDLSLKSNGAYVFWMSKDNPDGSWDAVEAAAGHKQQSDHWDVTLVSGTRTSKSPQFSKHSFFDY